jgi:signal transduction histidine kinase/CheY-like chemotaxis protein
MNTGAGATPERAVTAGPLRRVLAWRLVAVALVALVVLAAVLAVVYAQLQERSAALRLQEALAHYTLRTQGIDSSWLRQADTLRVQLEFSGLLADEDATRREARLTALVNSLGGRWSFKHLALYDAQGRRTFGDTAPAAVVPSGPRPQLGWVYDASQAQLYRTVWLAARIGAARGDLVLLAAVDNSLLGDNAVPDTSISLHWEGVERATSIYSAGTPRLAAGDGVRRAQGRINWSGLDGPGPVLQVVRQIASPVNAVELVGIVAVAGAVAVLLGWLVFGRWLRGHTGRLLTLEKVATEFGATHVLSADLERRVDETIHGASDEMHSLGAGLRVLMREVEASAAAQRELNLHLEERVGQRTQELAEARDAALAASRAKAQFLANMSHELRTPLTGLLGGLELMRDLGTGDEQRRLLEVASCSGEALLAVINDVLDHSKIEAGKLTLQAQPFRIDELLAEVVSLFAASAARKGLALRADCDPSIDGCWVEGDPMRLRQVMLNLVGNALKFTDRGHVELRLRVTEAAAARVSLRLEVEDSGIGIDAAAQAQLFEAFVQADASDRRSRGGTGLGLAISRRLVHLMGSEIELRSEPGRGSTFGFALQLPRAWPPSAVMPAAVQPLPTLAGRVLLVEDNPVVRLVASIMLEQRGLQVHECHDGAEAVAFLRQEAVDLVLMDCQMPVLDGFAATAQIRVLEAAQGMRRTPIVALTANALEGDAERCRAAGMDGYVTKPFVQEQLVLALAPWLRTPVEASMQALAQEPTQTPTPETVATTPLPQPQQPVSRF